MSPKELGLFIRSMSKEEIMLALFSLLDRQEHADEAAEILCAARLTMAKDRPEILFQELPSTSVKQ